MSIPLGGNLPISLISNIHTITSEVNKPFQVNHELSYQTSLLQTLFGDEKGISAAISSLRKDRLSNSEELVQLK